MSAHLPPGAIRAAVLKAITTANDTPSAINAAIDAVSERGPGLRDIPGLRRLIGLIFERYEDTHHRACAIVIATDGAHANLGGNGWTDDDPVISHCNPAVEQNPEAKAWLEAFEREIFELTLESWES